MRHHQVTRPRGFTLIEAMIALAVLAAAGTLYWLYMAGAERKQAQESMAKLQAQQMAQITRAMLDYGAANKASWTPGSYYEVTIPTLISAGHLPANFGTYNQIGISPFGQNYRAKGGRSVLAPDTIMTIVTEFGVPTSAALTRAGLSNTPVAIKALKQQIATAIFKENNMPSGVLDPTASIVQGNFSGFQFNLSAWFAEAMPNSARVAVIKNVPPVDVPATGGATGNPMQQYVSCAPAVIAWQAPSAAVCPGGYVEVSAWPNCGAQFGTADPIRSTPVGTITFGEFEHSVPQYNEACREECTTGPRVSCSLYDCDLINYDAQDTKIFETLNINNAAMGSSQCRHQYWFRNGSNRASQANVSATQYNNKLCCLPR